MSDHDGVARAHGQVINVEEAERMGIKVRRMPAHDPLWDAYWRLYCLQKLAVKDGEKIFESEFASLIAEPSH